MATKPFEILSVKLSASLATGDCDVVGLTALALKSKKAAWTLTTSHPDCGTASDAASKTINLDLCTSGSSSVPYSVTSDRSKLSSLHLLLTKIDTCATKTLYLLLLLQLQIFQTRFLRGMQLKTLKMVRAGFNVLS